ncbi:MAG: hypothetical protein VB055_08865 [Oscillospiraceae bacterium]|nr:hypothetical protein [Oscillospiraceae bacterium]
MNWKHLVRAVAFLCVLGLLLSGFSALLFPKTNEPLYKYNAGGVYGEPTDSLDYLFVGDSNVAEGFSPLDVWEETGAAGYACAEPWQTLCGCYYMLKGILQYQHPKLVMLDTDSFFFNRKSLKSTEATLETIFGASFSVFRYHNNWKQLSAATLFQEPVFSWRPETKGHAVSLSVKSASDADYMENRKLPTKYVPLLLQFYMQRIQALCEENGAQLLIVSVPCASLWSDAAHDAVQLYADRLDIPYIDLNEYQDEIGMDWDEDTRDGGTHLNAYGAKKITLFLSQYLTEHFDLPDHRGETAYADWDTAYADYLSSMEG